MQSARSARAQARQNRKSRLHNASSNGAVVSTPCVLSLSLSIYIYIYPQGQLKLDRRLGGRGGTHLDSRGFTLAHLVSLGLTWAHLDSLGLTRAHLDARYDTIRFDTILHYMMCIV